MEQTNEKKQDHIITFNKPYKFEGKEYTEVDFSSLEDLTGEDLIEADKAFMATGQVAMVSELSLGYLMIVAATATKKPIEFFSKLPAKEALKVKNTVMAFLNN